MLQGKSTMTDGAPVSKSEDQLVTFYVGGWLVDPTSGNLSKANDLVRLEPKVMDVLVELAKVPGKVVTREHLEQTVWVGTVVSYDVLSTTMLKLRKAFNDNSKNPQFIETIPKKGYRLVAPVHGTSAEVSQASPALPSQSRPHRRYLQLGGGLVLGLLLVMVVLYFLRREQDVTIPVDQEVSQVSIVILPFTNLNADPQEDYFVDGITNDLTTDLTRLSGLFVISRDSAFVYKDSTISTKQVAEKLHVRYVLHGSVRRQQDRIRINVVLTDASHGTHIWADRYDGNTNDIFKLQDEISHKIISALAVKLTPAERQSLVQAETQNICTVSIISFAIHGTATERRGIFSKKLSIWMHILHEPLPCWAGRMPLIS